MQILRKFFVCDTEIFKNLYRKYDMKITYRIYFSNDNASSGVWQEFFRAATFSESLLRHSKHLFRAGTSSE